MTQKVKTLGLLAMGALAAFFVTTENLTDRIGKVKQAEAASSSVSSSNNSFFSPTMSIADIAESSVASVVNISTTQTPVVDRGPMFFDPFFQDPFRRGNPRKAQSLGSGVIVSKKGYVLTNSHVVRGSETIKVALSDGRQRDATLVGTDPESDLAVLQLKGDISNIRPLRFANSDKVRLGEIVLAIGNPFGVGQAVTMGIISAKGRANVGIVAYEDFIQTDAAINPGKLRGRSCQYERRASGY